MPVFREWALIAVYHQAEADDLEHFEEMTRNMSVMDFHWDETASTMIQMQVGIDKHGDPEFKTIATEQLSLFGEEATYGSEREVRHPRRRRSRR